MSSVLLILISLLGVLSVSRAPDPLRRSRVRLTLTEVWHRGNHPISTRLVVREGGGHVSRSRHCPRPLSWLLHVFEGVHSVHPIELYILILLDLSSWRGHLVVKRLIVLCHIIPVVQLVLWGWIRVQHTFIILHSIKTSSISIVGVLSVRAKHLRVKGVTLHLLNPDRASIRRLRVSPLLALVDLFGGQPLDRHFLSFQRRHLGSAHLHDLALVQSGLRCLNHCHLVLGLSLLCRHLAKRLVDSLFRAGPHSLARNLLLQGILQDLVFSLKVLLSYSLLYHRGIFLVLYYKLLSCFVERLGVHFVFVSFVKFILVHRLLGWHIRLFHVCR